MADDYFKKAKDRLWEGLTRQQDRQKELEHERQLAAIRAQSHTLVWTGTPDHLIAIITEWYQSGWIAATSLQDALQKAAINFLTPDGTRVIKPDAAGIPPKQKSIGAAPLPPKDAELPKRTKKQDLSRYLDTASLTDKQYQCASLRWEYGLSVSAIARELQISRKTVDQHIDYAQKKMRSSGLYEKVKKGLSKYNLQSEE